MLLHTKIHPYTENECVGGWLNYIVFKEVRELESFHPTSTKKSLV